MNPSKEITYIQNVSTDGEIFSNIKRHDTAFYVNSGQSIHISPYNQGDVSALSIDPRKKVHVDSLDVKSNITANTLDLKQKQQSFSVKNLEADSASTSKMDVKNALNCDKNKSTMNSEVFHIDSDSVVLGPQSFITFKPVP